MGRLWLFMGCLCMLGGEMESELEAGDADL